MQKLITILALVNALLAQCPDNDKYCAQCITTVNSTTTLSASGNTTTNSTSSGCRLCHGAFLGTSGICSAPATSYAHCVSYDSSSNCLACDYNYYLSSANQCTAISADNCAVYTAVLGCTVCKSGKLINNGTCNNGNSGCAAPNCENCSAANQCLRCNLGYVLLTDKNFTCISDGNNNVQNANNANITNYVAYSDCLTSAGGICTECRFGYYSSNGTCAAANGIVQGGSSSASLVYASVIALVASLWL